MMIFMLVVTGHSSTSTNRYGWTAVDFARQCNNLTVGSQSSLLSCLVVLCPLSLNISRVVLQGADIMESKNVSCSTLCRHGVALLMDFPLSPFLILTSSLFQTDADKFAVDVGKVCPVSVCRTCFLQQDFGLLTFKFHRNQQVQQRPRTRTQDSCSQVEFTRNFTSKLAYAVHTQ